MTTKTSIVNFMRVGSRFTETNTAFFLNKDNNSAFSLNTYCDHCKSDFWSLMLPAELAWTRAITSGWTGRSRHTKFDLDWVLGNRPQSVPHNPDSDWGVF